MPLSSSPSKFRSAGGMAAAFAAAVWIAACGVPSSNVLCAAGIAAAVESIRNAPLQGHVAVLASDTFEGREAGTRGGKAAGVYLVDRLKQLNLQPGGDRNGYFQEFGFEYRNIFAVWPGSDETLKHEYIILGAHYDHVGYGNANNSLGPVGYIHNGADDNASGAAALLELAKALTVIDRAPKRSILFAFWDAEEKGLLGSKHWTNHPTVSFERVRLVVNLDMIGRLKHNAVTVYGIRTMPGLRRLVSSENQQSNLNLDFNWDIEHDSDHYPFVTRRVPYLMFFTRKHEDYHRPSDDVDKLNVDGMRSITQLVLRSAYALAERDSLPGFRATALRENERMHVRYEHPLDPLPSRLGISWRAQTAEQREVHVTAVSPGSPADRAGMRIGDQIVQFGKHRPEEFPDFRALVYAARNPVTVLVRRNGSAEPLIQELVLDGAPLRWGIAWRIDTASPGTVLLLRVAPGSPAERAGLKVADRIYSVGGQGFQSSEEFGRLIHSTQNAVEVLVERGGRLRTVELKPVPEDDRHLAIQE